MKVQAVVEARLRELDEVTGGERHLVGEELDFDDAEGGIEGGDRVGHGGEGYCMASEVSSSGFCRAAGAKAPIGDGALSAPRAARILRRMLGSLYFRNNGNGTFAPAVSVAVPGNPVWVVAHDLDGNGKLDLAVAAYTGSVQVLLGKGDGTFAAPVGTPVPNQPKPVVVGRFDAGTSADLAVRSTTGVTILAGNGVGSFTAGPTIPFSGIPAWLETADIDGDGISDLLVAEQPPPVFPPPLEPPPYNAIFLRGNGDGTFASPPGATFAIASGSFAGATGDFNGDGLVDFALGSVDANAVQILLNRGNGTIAPPVSFPAGGRVDSMAAADLNGDGKADIVCGDAVLERMNLLLSP